MIIERWEVKLSKCNQNVGGYSVLSGNLKENIKLGRRAQKYLKELRNLQLKPLKIGGYENCGTINGEEYFLEVIHITSGRQKIDVAVGKTWNVTNIENDNKEELQYELFKEKLKVEKQDMLFFSWMKSLSVQLNAPLHQKMTEHGLADDNTRLEWFNIPLLRRSQYRKKVPYPSLRQMSSVLEVQCNTLTEEKLNFCVGFSDKPLSEWKPQIFEQTCNRYRLQRISPEKSFKYKSRCSKYNFKTSSQSWVVKVPEYDQQLNTFEQRYDELFDAQFNKLEFFKIRMKKLKKNKPIEKKNYKIWCLEKEDLKDLVWDPLKRICNHSRYAIFEHVTINREAYSIKPLRLTFQKLDSGSLDLIDNQKKTFGSIKLAMSMPDVKKTENQSIEESERHDETAIETEEFDENDCLSSKADINTSLAPQKRSFIDNELMSMLVTKKKIKKDKDVSDTGISSTSYLINSGTYANSHIEIPTSNSVYNGKEDCSFNKYSVKHSILEEDIENKCIAVNENKVIENQKVIQSLCKNSHLDLIEQPYFGECDFIINHSTCVYKIQASRFMQLRNNGSLHYDKAINDLLTEFQRVIIIVEFSEIIQDVDPDLFWKIKLYLLNSRVDVFFIHETTDFFIDWMKYFIAKWAFSYNDEKEKNIANADILLDLGFNILLVRKIFQTYSLEEFFMAIIKEESKAVKMLTVSQMTRLKKLLTLEW
ncbi:CIH_collapsed_G0014830.mRNA.1.CDS.1 [Saccharomyces cerevisiae]|nr:CIH_collapsed_G0014830.mRNA.1.CDS.1 [Saccharomyces cerevisiae]